MRSSSASDFSGDASPEEGMQKEIANEPDEEDPQSQELAHVAAMANAEGNIKNPIKELVDKYFPNLSVRAPISRTAATNTPKETPICSNESIAAQIRAAWESSETKRKFESSIFQLAS